MDDEAPGGCCRRHAGESSDGGETRDRSGGRIAWPIVPLELPRENRALGEKWKFPGRITESNAQFGSFKSGLGARAEPERWIRRSRELTVVGSKWVRELVRKHEACSVLVDDPCSELVKVFLEKRCEMSSDS